MARQHDPAKRSNLRRRSKSASNLTIRNVISSGKTDTGPLGKRLGTYSKDPSSVSPKGRSGPNDIDEDGNKHVGPETRCIDMQTHLKRCGELEQRCGELEQELEAVTEEWKKSARELNELQARAQTSGQVTDGNLIDRVQQLRYAIWNFSIQYFDRERLEGAPRSLRNDTEYFWILESTTPESKIYQEYLRTPSLRAKIVAAFLWRLLFHRVFGRFPWTTEPVARCLEDLRDFLQPGNRPPELGMTPPRPEAERAFQMWSTTTIQLVLDAIYTQTSNTETAQAYLRERKLAIRSGFVHTFGLQSSPEIHGISRQLDEIFEGDSVAAGKEGRKIRVVIAPALVKRGRSSGDDFDMERILLKRVVCCD